MGESESRQNQNQKDPSPPLKVHSMPFRWLEESSSEVCESQFTESQTRTLRAVTLTGAALSILGCLFIIVSYVLLIKLRTFPYRLVILLSVANLGSSLAYFVGLAGVSKANDKTCNSTFGCFVGAVMTQFFDLAGFFWIAVIAFNVDQVMIRGKGRVVEGYIYFYHLFAWGLSGVFTLAVVFSLSIGDAGLWCWISQNRQAVRFFCYYLPLIVVFVYTAVTYGMVSFSLRGGAAERTTVTNRLRLYVLVFLFVRIWSVLHRAQNFVSKDDPLFALALLHAIFSPLQGFANALVYGLNRNILREYGSICHYDGMRSGGVGDFGEEVVEVDESGFELPTNEPDGSELAPISLQ